MSCNVLNLSKIAYIHMYVCYVDIYIYIYLYEHIVVYICATCWINGVSDVTLCMPLVVNCNDYVSVRQHYGGGMWT